jgi:hypothetical protein
MTETKQQNGTKMYQNQYGTGSTCSLLRDLIAASPLSDDVIRTILIEFAVSEAEYALDHAAKAGRNPYKTSWKSIRAARSILQGETPQKWTHESLQEAKFPLMLAANSDDRRAYPPALAAYEAVVAATSVGFSVTNIVSVLLACAFYAYTLGIAETTFTTARAAECETMDRQRATLRALLLPG